MRSFRAGWQSLLASLGTGIEQSRLSEFGLPAGDKEMGHPNSDRPDVAPSSNLPCSGGETQFVKAGTGKVVLPKTNAAPENVAGLRAGISAGRIATGSPHPAAVAVKDTTTAGSEGSPSATGRASKGESARPAASGTVVATEPQPYLPAQMVFPAMVPTPQTVNLTQARPLQTESAKRTAIQAEPPDEDDLRRPGPGTEVLPISKGDQLTGVRPARVAGDREAVSSQAATTMKSGGIPESDSSLDSSLDESVKGNDTPAAPSAKSVQSAETHIVPEGTQTLNPRGAETGSQATGLPTVPGETEKSVPSVLAFTDAGLQGSQPNVVSSVANKTGSSSVGRTSANASTRATHPTGAGTANQHGSNLAQIQPAGQAQEISSSGLARDLAGLRGTAGTAVNSASETNAAVASPASRDAFSAIDSEPASRTYLWIHAGANRAEAGYQDPALGWVSVRADVEGRGIHASLVPASTDAAQALGGHLAGLNAHLTEQHMPVETLTLAAPEDRSADAGMDQNANQHMHQGAGQESQPNRQPGTGMEGSAARAVSPSDLPSSVRGLEGTPAAIRPSGAHISVMA